MIFVTNSVAKVAKHSKEDIEKAVKRNNCLN